MLNSTIYGFSRDTYFFLEIMMVKKKFTQNFTNHEKLVLKMKLHRYNNNIVWYLEFKKLLNIYEFARRASKNFFFFWETKLDLYKGQVRTKNSIAYQFL